MQKNILGLVLIAFVRSEPQLDLPGLQHSTEAPRQNGLKVVVLPNSYANDDQNNQPKSEANSRFDQDDRSLRYGMRYEWDCEIIKRVNCC